MEIVWPLVGCRTADPLEGGFGYLDLTADGVTPHPGVDLNAGAGGDADCGLPVVAPADLTIRAVVNGIQNGYGNHVWAETDGDHVWLHTAHHTMIGLPMGSHVLKGHVYATCGKTNGWSNGWPFCHVHFEVRRERPPTWEYWPAGLPKAQVAALYLDPIAWLEGQAADPPPEDQMSDTERQQLQSQIDQQRGINATLQQQLDAVRGQLADAQSTIGALEHDVIPALESAAQGGAQAQLDALKATLAQIAALASAAPAAGG